MWKINLPRPDRNFKMDVQLLAQGIVYFCMFSAGMVMSITVGVNRARFDGQCILYASFSGISRRMKSSSGTTCDFPIYVAVVGLVIYGFVMGAYYIYSFMKSKKNPNRGFQMYVMPVLLFNSVLFICLLVAACMVSVGYAVFCNNYLEGAPEGIECSIGENSYWQRVSTGEMFNPGNYVAFMNTCMIFAWLGVLSVLIQLSLDVLRVYRNRRHGPSKSQSTSVDNLPYWWHLTR